MLKSKIMFGFLFLLLPTMYSGGAFAGGISSESQFVLNNLSQLFFAVLIIWMVAGFSMLEAGMVSTKSTAVICLKNVVLYSIACLCFFFIGFNLMYEQVGQWIGKLSLFVQSKPEELSLLAGNLGDAGKQALFEKGTTVHMSNWFFQMSFVATTASIISGTLAERVKLWSFFIFIAFFTSFIYPIVGAWTWGGGWLSQIGFQDFAGSTIVHSVGGWAALAGALLVGPRRNKFLPDGTVRNTFGSNLPLATLGTLILWIGWLGFNGGSRLAVGTGQDITSVVVIFVNTNLAACSGVLCCLILGRLFYRRVNLPMILNGAISGLVAITAGPELTNHLYTLLIGGIGGAICMFATRLLDRFKIDDVVGAIPAHLAAGIWGTLAVGIFSENPLTPQVVGVVSIGAFTFMTTFVIWFVLKNAMGVRVSAKEEELGQDLIDMGLEAYPEFLTLDSLQAEKSKKGQGIKSSSLDMSTNTKDGIPLLSLSGRLDSSSSMKAYDHLEKNLLKENTSLLVDMSQVHFVSSAGIRIMLSTAKSMKKLNGKLAFCSIDSNVLRVLKISGVVELLNIYETQEQAIDALKKMS